MAFISRILASNVGKKAFSELIRASSFFPPSKKTENDVKWFPENRGFGHQYNKKQFDFKLGPFGLVSYAMLGIAAVNNDENEASTSNVAEVRNRIRYKNTTFMKSQASRL